MNKDCFGRSIIIIIDLHYCHNRYHHHHSPIVIVRNSSMSIIIITVFRIYIVILIMKLSCNSMI